MKEIVFDKQPPENEVHIVNAEPSWPWLLTVRFSLQTYSTLRTEIFVKTAGNQRNHQNLTHPC